MAFDKKEYQKRYNEAHPEKVKEMHHNYYLRHKEEILEGNKRWRRNNRKKASELAQKYRKERVERLRAEGCTNAWSVVVGGKEPKYKRNSDKEC